ncbi:Cadherin EGF LAG seven-pass G-type receptor 1 [Saguinus oedipus]|uniref:Cadherin EGF LAG seven-pass G-type receptor 1 n=1 Tax=Saguinus oedipus TaxID=9490 RepID=A0ABQ9VGC0_SAGOE|nr:Cadherin EGF LAG seven-pass G-type receptor 1 [Saguinus oedipus]
MSSSTRVSIMVLDVNDNDPVFTQPTYELRLNEDAAVGSSVLTLQACDRSANTHGRQHPEQLCAEQPEAGGGLITLALPLDYKQEQQYVMAVTASDGTPSHTVHVLITVTDANTHRLVSQSSNYTVSISEDRPVGTSIATLSANDKETGENARITYVIQDPVPQFRIDPDSGTMYTMMELDYEDQVAYTLTFMALDNGRSWTPSPWRSSSSMPMTTHPSSCGISTRVPSLRMLHPQPASSRSLPWTGTRVPMGVCCTPSRMGTTAMGTSTTSPRLVRRLDRENVAVYNLWAVAVDCGSPTALSA